MMSVTRRVIRAFLLCSVLGLGLVLPAKAQELSQTLLHTLGYIGVDYPTTVAAGRVLNAAEYAEQQEFAQRVRDLMGQLPNSTEKPVLVAQAAQLIAAIDRRESSKKVVPLIDSMRASLIRAYEVVVSPQKTPNLAKAAQLYAQNCSACHGKEGRGDGPAAVGLDPAPSNFHDAERQNQRDVYALYNTISLGLDGTPMPSFAQLKDDERWALAFYVSNFLANDAQRREGAALWAQGDYNQAFPDLARLTQLTPAETQKQWGESGVKVLAYLRSQPAQVLAAREPPLVFTARKLNESFAQYQTGKREAAYASAVSAYLEGFELVETGLATINPELRAHAETQMYRYRSLIREGQTVEAVGAQLTTLQGILEQVNETLDNTNLTPSMAFVSALVILLREGMEALLLVAAIAAFLIKTGRREALVYVHLGWIGALLLGVFTWFVATYFVSISGANREVTEGITALLAAGILFYVGVWLHNKLQAQRWKEFIEAKVQRAAAGRTLWALALVSFIAVYREVFETVLFYKTLWLQAGDSGQNMVLSGFFVAALALVVLAWLIFRFSVRLPLRLFFGINSALMYILAVVFAGKGVAALQEAGKLPISSVDFPRIDILGIYPNVQALSLQGLLVMGALVFLYLNRRAAQRTRS